MEANDELHSDNDDEPKSEMQLLSPLSKVIEEGYLFDTTRRRDKLNVHLTDRVRNMAESVEEEC